jgi:hypothetical protein
MLSEKINASAAGLYEALRRVHETVNAHGSQIAVVSARGDLNKGLGSLGKALMQAVDQIKPQS